MDRQGGCPRLASQSGPFCSVLGTLSLDRKHALSPLYMCNEVDEVGREKRFLHFYRRWRCRHSISKAVSCGPGRSLDARRVVDARCVVAGWDVEGLFSLLATLPSSFNVADYKILCAALRIHALSCPKKYDAWHPL